jgi:hypothetical protein
MAIHLYLAELDTVKDSVAFLWDEEKYGAPEKGIRVETPEEYETQAFSVLGASTRTRAITLVDTESAARAVAGMQASENEAETVIIQLDDELFCVGSLMLSGEYDDGIPLITDLTTGNTIPDITPEVMHICSYYRLDEDELVSIGTIGSAEPDMEMV